MEILSITALIKPSLPPPPVLLIGQLFGVMPISGITSNNISDLRFSWRSYRFYYTILCALLMLIYSSYVAVWAFDGSLDFPRYGNPSSSSPECPPLNKLPPLSVSLLFNISNLFSLVEFVQIARRWPALMQDWRMMEQRTGKWDLPPRRGMSLKRRIAYITAAVLLLSAVEHILSLITTISFVERCAHTSNFTYEIFAWQFQPLQPTISDYIPKAVFGRFVLTVSTFLWSYSDLFIILISVALSGRMKAFNRYLEQQKYRHLSEDQWEENRNHFVMFSELSGHIDQVVCKLTLVSFSNDIFFICVQLLNSLK